MRRPDAPKTLALCAALLLGGCALPPPPPPPPLPAPFAPLGPADVAARQLLAHHAQLQDQGAEALATALRLPDALDPPPADAVQRALSLMLGRRGADDSARARALLERVLADTSPQAEAWRGSARLLVGLLGEQQRLEELLERQIQQNREQQREAQRKLEQLNEKLEALKAIERSLQGVRPAPPARQP